MPSASRARRPLRSALFIAAACSTPVATGAAPSLLCTVSASGERYVVRAIANVSPYSAPAIPIGDRFLFRAVFQPAPRRPDAIRLYVYRADADAAPRLLHEAVFASPPGAARSGIDLIGRHLVYEGELGRALEYSCRVVAVSFDGAAR